MPFSVFADTIYVPGDHPTIQSAIDSARSSDIIMLSDGTYTGTGNFDIVIKGKSVTIQSVNGPDNCIVDCQYNGRGFKLSDNGLVVTFEGLTIKNGDTKKDKKGGAIYSNDSRIIVNNCIFDGNKATTGGAIYSFSSTLNHCTFINNGASGTGGAIYSSSSPTFNNCTFTNNSGFKGGAVASPKSPTFTNCIFSGNTASNYGGAVYSSSESELAFMTCTFTNNSAIDGGAIYSAGFPSFSGCSFTSNCASDNGGAIVAITTYSNDCAFIGNHASDDGGAIYSFHSTLTNCTFTNNDCNYKGGAFFSHSSTLNNCIFANNNVNYDGGAVYISGLSRLTDCIFTSNNTSSGNGGAVFSVSTNFSGCKFTNNCATSSGGAVYSSAEKASNIYTFTNCIFNNNSASKGGAVHQESSTYSYTNCTLTSNSATYGGAVYIPYYSSSTFTNCTFTRNDAYKNGGTIWCYTKSSPLHFVIINNCILWENYAPVSAGIYEKEKPASVTFSDIQGGGYTGEGNIDANPLFVDAYNNNLYLQYNSPCIDVGTSKDAPPEDLDKKKRPVGKGYDMGAYECQFVAINRLPIISSFSATPLSGQLPLFVTFTCEAYDPDGDIISEYQWDFNNDGNIDLISQSSKIGYTYATSGSYSAVCTVVDNNGGMSTSKIIEITISNSLYVKGSYNYYLPYYSSFNNSWTGLGLANQSRKNINTLQATVYNCEGRPLTAENKTITANGQDAFAVAPQLNTRGWIWLNSHQPVSGLAFLGRSCDVSSLMTDIPFISKLSSCLLIPHIAQNETWDTTIFICNPNNETVSITLKYINQAGIEQKIQNYTIHAHGSETYLLSMVFSNEIPMAGKLEINSSNGIAAFALYSDLKNGGTHFAGINAENCE